MYIYNPTFFYKFLDNLLFLYLHLWGFKHGKCRIRVTVSGFIRYDDERGCFFFDYKPNSMNFEKVKELRRLVVSKSSLREHAAIIGPKASMSPDEMQFITDRIDSYLSDFGVEVEWR